MNNITRTLITVIFGFWGTICSAATLEMFSADWCRYCQQAKKDLLTERQLVDKYMLEIIDVDRSPDLKTANNIKTLPTFILRDDSGKEIARQTGYQGMRKLKLWLRHNDR